MEFTVSEMAQMHGLSRQTLIYYDKIGLFQPARKDETGKRYYSSQQMPALREICILKQLGVPLKEIKKVLSGHDRKYTVEFLKEQLEHVNEMKKNLELTEETLQYRLALYSSADYNLSTDRGIFVEEYPERYAWYVPWPREQMSQDKLRICFSKAMEQLRPKGIMPSFGIGAKIRWEQILTESPLENAGSIFFLPEEFKQTDGVQTISPGKYYCMNVFAMPYKLGPIFEFYEEIRSRRIRTTGDLISICLLDGNFYNASMQEDFCQLQIMVND